MTYVITEPCIDVKDKSCVEVCPVDCIHFDEDDVPDNWKEYTALNAQWYKDKAAVRAKVNALKPA